jgi:hypothetical protein
MSAGGPPAKIRRCDPALAPAAHLFVHPGFNAFQAHAQNKRLVTFGAFRDEAGRPVAALTLAEGSGVWTSPVTGAFGGLATDGRVGADLVGALAVAATAWLRAEAGGAARIRLPPGCFPDDTAAALENALFREGWSLAEVDLNYHLPVVAPEAYVRGLRETRQKEIRRLRRSGAVARRLPLSDGEVAYRTVAANRAARGYPMTMAWDQMWALAEAFPDVVGFHVVERAGEILAGGITLRLTAAYAYVFYWGEAPEHRAESPVVLLAEALMAEAHAAGVAILDIGASTDASLPNPGLIAFKESLGCLATPKTTWEFRPHGAGAGRE